MLVHDAKRSLKILVTNVQLSVTFATGWAPKNMGGGGLCFQVLGSLGVLGVFVFKTPVTFYSIKQLLA